MSAKNQNCVVFLSSQCKALQNTLPSLKFSKEAIYLCVKFKTELLYRELFFKKTPPSLLLPLPGK